jgi:hypothetical protein
MDCLRQNKTATQMGPIDIVSAYLRVENQSTVYETSVLNKTRVRIKSITINDYTDDLIGSAGELVY